ncbi:MAG: c-type cytochrome, partial [bacterium]|nr:c-type cytochrome [bacterium]
MKSGIAVLIVALAAPPGFRLLAQEPEVRNPHTSAKDVAAGGRMYRSHCANCHGTEGEGGRGPNLTSGNFRHGGSDQDLYTTISDGI